MKVNQDHLQEDFGCFDKVVTWEDMIRFDERIRWWEHHQLEGCFGVSDAKDFIDAMIGAISDIDRNIEEHCPEDVEVPAGVLYTERDIRATMKHMAYNAIHHCIALHESQYPDHSLRTEFPDLPYSIYDKLHVIYYKGE